jgi:hypothetical protein
MFPDYRPLWMQLFEWLRHEHTAGELFLHNILWKNEACFTCEGVFNVHNSRFRARDNPHAIRKSGYEVRFRVSVWTRIVGENVVGPYLLFYRLTAQRYCDFLAAVLSGLLEDVPLGVRQRLRGCGFRTKELQRTMGKMPDSGWLDVKGPLHGLFCRRIQLRWVLYCGDI